ncbi:hypothetical protein SARC_02237 [Sphaeroforma arctica JP610]|uniref:Uncharacterized protein n=1 Tax=Sphaeroforma arctica JP610 TaxID=667725 RepID=A0A0L0G9C3_9EUKA|nr:hypothetical protein SARC_02237 [Sphaeroforma arctica JP610]KNC85580.1 hypothetical protein SARC_02237 [Sphaeroforma arctica JP610]|eukprot:XP_014159482.1 hypothetical protein SARC_02237 [Sphaeroforma arctica JP610]
MGAAHSSGEATFDRVERDDNADVDISAELLHSLQEPEKSQSSDSAKSQPPPQTFTYTNSPPVDNAKEADLELMRENIEHLLKESKNEGIKEGRQILDSEETAVSQKAIDKIEEDATDKILSDELQAEQSLEKALNDFEVRHGYGIS